ncbi:NADH-quinone oxidoreductase subunit G [Moraxella ovis]|nr:NADH-quinone oxidoreductase subunit G [Moraxella ovis]
MSEEDYQAGRGKLVMSCMIAPTPKSDTWISVDDAEAKAFRKSIVEYLMTNHPTIAQLVRRVVIAICKT